MAGSDLSTSLNKSGQGGATPRAYDQHMRHGTKARYPRHARQFSAFLTTQGTRLSLTAAQIFTKLKKYTAAKIKSAATSSDIS